MLSTVNPRYIGDDYAVQVGTIIDITQLERRQQEDLARQKLKSLGTLAGGAHDSTTCSAAFSLSRNLSLRACRGRVA
jgi:hypothetical protein